MAQIYVSVSREVWSGDLLFQAPNYNPHGPHAALDGSVDTWFGSAFGAEYVTVTVDLGSYFTIDAITITWKCAHRLWSVDDYGKHYQ